MTWVDTRIKNFHVNNLEWQPQHQRFFHYYCHPKRDRSAFPYALDIDVMGRESIVTFRYTNMYKFPVWKGFGAWEYQALGGEGAWKLYIINVEHFNKKSLIPQWMRKINPEHSTVLPQTSILGTILNPVSP